MSQGYKQGCQWEEAEGEECPYIVSEIITSDVDESQKSIFWCKTHRFPWKIGIPDQNHGTDSNKAANLGGFLI